MLTNECTTQEIACSRVCFYKRNSCKGTDLASIQKLQQGLLKFVMAISDAGDDSHPCPGKNWRQWLLHRKADPGPAYACPKGIKVALAIKCEETVQEETLDEGPTLEDGSQ